jgi:anti-sigma factor RsiW
MAAPDDLPCAELVTLLSDYLEGTLDDETARMVERHLETCDGCDAYLSQLETTIEVAGRLAAEELDPRLREGLLAAFRGWRAEPPG